jgi:Lon protease-like protein
MLDRSKNIPLFPLNTVLFPGMMLPLHIFEERYKTMIKECLGDNHIFGVVLAKNRQAVAPNVSNIFFDDIYTVGTTAHITAIEQLDDGRMNLITVGQERFIIKNIKPGLHDYLVGEVDPLPLQHKNTPQSVNKLASTVLKPMVEQYIQNLADASGENFPGANLPDDAESLAYLAGTAVQGPLAEKQKLLAINSLEQLVSETVGVLDKENKILAYMLKAYHQHQTIDRLPFVDYSLN